MNIIRDISVFLYHTAQWRCRVDWPVSNYPSIWEKALNMIQRIAVHCVGKCCLCGCSGKTSDCVVEHVYISNPFHLSPTEFYIKNGAKMAYCGLYVSSLTMHKLLEDCWLIWRVYTGRSIARGSPRDPGQLFCIDCVMNVLTGPDPLSLLSSTGWEVGTVPFSSTGSNP
uniref:Protein 4 n=1 Tax=Sciadopitys virus 1_Can TaxID=2977986 RepID=A0A9N6YJ46_9RHAB|nr:TPA_asm: protein 4 [Sciadopitys virus 1_Can]